MVAKSIAFVGTEIGIDDKKIHDIGAILPDHTVFHSVSIQGFRDFIAGTEFICGHNIIHHDLKYLQRATGQELPAKPIDTLYLSPLLFPKRPYHSLLQYIYGLRHGSQPCLFPHCCQSC